MKKIKKKYNYTCRYCNVGFVREKTYLNHVCTSMKRDAEIKTPEGQAAWGYYRLWFKFQNKLQPNASAFCVSRFYRSFFTFAVFMQKIEMLDSERYVKIMTTNKISPAMWKSPEAYYLYIEAMDSHSTPKDQLVLSVETIINFCDKREIEYHQFYDNINNDELIIMLQVRKLFPWMLLNNNNFKKFFREKLTPHDRVTVGALIDTTIWKKKFKDNPTTVESAKEFLKQLGL